MTIIQNSLVILSILSLSSISITHPPSHKLGYLFTTALPQVQRYSLSPTFEPLYHSNVTILSPDELSTRACQQAQRQERFLRRTMPDEIAAPAALDPALAAILETNNTNSAQLNTTLAALLAHFATPTQQVHDLCASPNPLNLAQRSGLTAYEKACEALDTKWDGSASDYPTFVVELGDRSRDCKWDATNGSGILDIPQDGTTLNIITNPRELRTTSIDAAYVARTNPCTSIKRYYAGDLPKRNTHPVYSQH